ncbi:MAG: hypothetical protein RKK15_13155 [Defluviicoccus sp.]|nr:hypothetical protein [Defluviicoccus sp.]
MPAGRGSVKSRALFAALALLLAGGCVPSERSALPIAEDRAAAVTLDYDYVSPTAAMLAPQPPRPPLDLKVTKKAIRHGPRAARPAIETPQPQAPASLETNRIEGDARFVRGRLDTIDSTTRSLSDPRGAWPESKADQRPGSPAVDEAGRLRLELERRALQQKARDLERLEARPGGSGYGASPLETQVERLRHGPRW